MVATIHEEQGADAPEATGGGAAVGGAGRDDGGRGWRIWIVAPDPQARVLVRRCLPVGASRRYCVSEMASGDACLRAWRASGAELPTCLLIAADLSDRDAAGLLSELGEPDAIPVAVLVLDAGGGPGQRAALIRAGAQDALDLDTISAAVLTRAVENAVLRHRAMRAHRAALASLRLSELRLRTLLDASADAIGLIGAHGFIECNPATLRLYGCRSAGEFIGRDPMDFSPPTQPDGSDSRAAAALHIAAAFRDGSHRFEWRHRRLDGSPFDIDLLLTRVDLPGGPVLQAIARDITARRQAEAQLVQAEERLRYALEATTDGLWDWEIPTGKVYHSPGYARMLGFEPGDLAPDHHTWVGLLHPADRDAMLAAVGASLSGPGHWELEFRLRRKAGDYAWIMGRGRVVARDRVGVPLRAVGTHVDITPRKSMEQALRESEGRFRTLFESSGDAQVILSEGRWVDCNDTAAALLGCAGREEVLNRCPAEFSPPSQPGGLDSRTLAERIVASILSLGRHRFEWLHRRADGTEFLAEVVATRMCLGGRQVIHGTMRDISERQALLEELTATKRAAEAANASKSLFLANVSHEIRTPMNAVMGLTDLCLGATTNERQRNFLIKIKRSSESLRHLIDDVLDFSKVEAGRLEVLAEPFELASVFDMLASMLGTRAQDKGLALSLRPPPSPAGVLVGDPHRLGQVLINLVGNAIKFTPRGGIGVEVAEASRTVDTVVLHFKVQDDGIGIPPEVLPHLFQPFSQGDASTTRNFGGTGLGLALSRRLVELMGGRIWVDSTVGRGSTFHFTVCVRLAAPGSVGAAARPAGLDRAALEWLQGKEVLVAEDNEINQEVIRELLEQAGLRVRLAANGEETLGALRTGAPDAVLMDCQMPVMDGYEATRRLRADPAHRELPVIALTANTLEGDRTRCLRAGMNDFVSKPVRVDDLLAVLARWIGPGGPGAWEPGGTAAPAAAGPGGCPGAPAPERAPVNPSGPLT